MELHSLLSNVWSILLVVVFFGGSIFVHELGHFLAARWRGVHVERFSIGFGPKIFSWRGKDGVEYRLSWLPLGGYVALPQLADMRAIEGESSAVIAKLPPPTYTSKVIVFVAGAAFNVVFAFLLACILWYVGLPDSSENMSTRIGYVFEKVTLPDGTQVPSPASQAGLRVGDNIRAIDGRKVESWQDIQGSVGLGAGRAPDGRRQTIFEVERDGRAIEVVLYPQLTGDEKDRRVGISPGYNMLVEKVLPGSRAEKAGFKPGDQIVSVDGTPVISVLTLAEFIEAPARALPAEVLRNGQPVTLSIPVWPENTDADKFGLSLTSELRLGHPTPWSQLGGHALWMYRTLASYVNPHSDINLSKFAGPVGIMRIFHSAAEAGIRAVLWFTILINVNLAIFNLLPIPVLDGGHILFATIAKLRGRPLPVDLIATTQSVFMVLLFSMIIYVSIFDVRRMMRDRGEERDAVEASQPAPTPEKPDPLPPTAVPATP